MRNHILNCRGYQIPLGEKSYLMGILNFTPDSFSDGGTYFSAEKAIKQAQQMALDGATIIDLGGESTRPTSTAISAQEEIFRIEQILEALLTKINIPLSIDTYKPEVASFVLEKGAHLINDIWGLQNNPQMAEIIAQYQVPIIIMHNQGHHYYPNDIIEAMKISLASSIELALKAGIKDKNIILDPGIGFGKNYEQNLQVLARLKEFNALGYPLLLGTSRKSFLGRALNLPPAERIEGTIATTVLGISQGFDFFRVHDVRENHRALTITDHIVRQKRCQNG